MDLAARVSAEKQMTLTAYQHLGAVDGEKEKLAVLDEIFADDAVTVINSQETFTPVKWGDNHAYLAEMRDKFRNRVYDVIKYRKFEIVELSWFYRKHNYKSKALVSDEGIVYDNIASFAIDYSVPVEKKDTTMTLKRPAAEDTINAILPKNIANNPQGAIFVVSDYADGRMLVIGKYAWYYKLRFISVFGQDGILCNRSLESNSESRIGWLLESNPEFTSGEIYKSKHQEYQWTLEYGDERGGKSGSSRTCIQQP